MEIEHESQGVFREKATACIVCVMVGNLERVGYRNV